MFSIIIAIIAIALIASIGLFAYRRMVPGLAGLSPALASLKAEAQAAEAVAAAELVAVKAKAKALFGQGAPTLPPTA